MYDPVERDLYAHLRELDSSDVETERLEREIEIEIDRILCDREALNDLMGWGNTDAVLDAVLEFNRAVNSPAAAGILLAEKMRDAAYPVARKSALLKIAEQDAAGADNWN